MSIALPYFAVPGCGVSSIAWSSASDPIIERIAAWHAAAFASITTANGYHQTLEVSRAGELKLEDGLIHDLTTICCLGSVTESDEDHEDTDHYCWRQSFDAAIFLIGDAGGGRGEDPRIADILWDIQAVIAEELNAADLGLANPFCDRLAYDIRPLPWSIGQSVQDPHLVQLLVPYLISFQQLKLDPYNQ